MDIEFKRIKHGQMPGDLPKRMKIWMREGRAPFMAWPWPVVSEKQAKSFRRFLSEKSRTVQRRRDKREIENAREFEAAEADPGRSE